MTSATELRALHDLPVQVGEMPVEWLLRNERWHAVMLPGFETPLTPLKVHALQGLLTLLDALLTEDPAVSGETLLQFSQLHVGGCARLVSERGSLWQPRMGLGVFPNEPPPQLWTAQDFEVMPEPGARMRPLMNTVLRVASKKSVQQEVAGECLISGGVMRFYTQDFAAFLRKSKEQLLPRLAGSAFQGHLFYTPVLNAASFRNTSDQTLDAWLPGVGAYVAQCPEEQAVVIAVRGDLATLLRDSHKQLTASSSAKRLT